MESRFQEIQRFRQPWVWLGLVPAVLLPALIFSYGMVQQLVWEEPWGGAGTTNAFLILVGGLVVVGAIAIVSLLAATRLRVTVDGERLSVSLPPLSARTVDLKDIAGHAPVHYQPLRAHGGRGKRRIPNGWAYTVCGTDGVEVTLTNGERIVIGSQVPDELDRALSSGTG